MILKRCLFIGAAIVCLSVIIAPSPVYALQLDSKGFSRQTIKRSDVRYEIERIDPENAEISLEGTGLITDDSGRLLVAQESCQPGERQVKGGAVYTWRSCGTDANNNRIDVRLSLRNITVMNPYSNVTDASLLLLGEGFGVYDQPKQGGASLQATALRPDTSGRLVEDPTTRLGASAEIELRITKTGTDTPANGTFIFSARGLNGIDSEMPSWSEQIELIDGFSDAVSVLPDTTLTITEENTTYTAGGGDEESYRGGLATYSDPGKTVFRWKGRGCRQLILDNFSPASISVKTNGHGSVFCNDLEVTSKWPVEWKGDAKFSFVPDIGYRNPSYSINGTVIGETAKWICSSATSDISLELTFQLYEYDIAYDPAAADATGDMPTQTASGNQVVTIRECAFVNEGYVFVGWNTKKDGSGTAYRPGQSVVNLARSHKQTVYLYAQWEPLITVSVPTKAICLVQADGTVISPENWKIKNLSKVAVKASSIEAGETIPGVGVMLSSTQNASYFQLEPNGTGKRADSVITLKPEGSETYVWSLRSDTTPWGTLSGKSLADILSKEDAPGTVGTVTFTFEQA